MTTDVMFARLKCWWHGHAIEASIYMDDRHSRFVYHCKRCKRVLPGPETGT